MKMHPTQKPLFGYLDNWSKGLCMLPLQNTVWASNPLPIYTFKHWIQALDSGLDHTNLSENKAWYECHIKTVDCRSARTYTGYMYCALYISETHIFLKQNCQHSWHAISHLQSGALCSFLICWSRNRNFTPHRCKRLGDTAWRRRRPGAEALQTICFNLESLSVALRPNATMICNQLCHQPVRHWTLNIVPKTKSSGKALQHASAMYTGCQQMPFMHDR